MQKNKSLGIRIHSIIFPHVVFQRAATIQSSEIDPQMEAKSSIDEDNNMLYVELKVTIQNEENSLHIEIICAGQFQEDAEEPNIALLKEFSKKDAPAVLFPYVREYISSLTAKSGISPILLPPINFNTIMVNDENDTQQKNTPKSTRAKRKK